MMKNGEMRYERPFRSSFVPLSHVFATRLMHCNPSDPRTLWDEHEHMFRQDIRSRARGRRNRTRKQHFSDDDMASFYVLQEVQDSLTFIGRSTLQDYELPEPLTDLPPLPGHDSESGPQHTGASRTASPEKFQEILRNSLPVLNDKQNEAFQQIVLAIIPGLPLQSILHGNNSNAATSSVPVSANSVFFPDAPEGTGKTFHINVIQAFLELRAIKVKPVATSAVAAGLLIGGRTAHSTFEIPIPALKDATCSISSNSDLARTLREAGLIMWDEVVMCHRFCIEAVDRTLRDLTGTNLPFGGKFVLFSRDFRQILLVISGGSRAQIVNPCIKSSALFDCCKTLRLIQNIRLQALHDDPSTDQESLHFSDFLISVGEGRVTSRSSVDPELIKPSDFSDIRVLSTQYVSKYFQQHGSKLHRHLMNMFARDLEEKEHPINPDQQMCR